MAEKRTKVAVTSAMAAIVGQNYGAGHYLRIQKTLRAGWTISSGVMIAGTILFWMFPDFLIGIFSNSQLQIQEPPGGG